MYELKIRVFKYIFSIFIVLTITIISTNSTSAYVLQGGYLNGGVSNQSYYVGSSNSRYLNAAIGAVNDWNYAVQNTSYASSLSFSFHRSTKITGSTIRFWGKNLPYTSTIAITEYYTIDSNYIGRIVNMYVPRDYSDVIFNTTLTEANLG